MSSSPPDQPQAPRRRHALDTGEGTTSRGSIPSRAPVLSAEDDDDDRKVFGLNAVVAVVLVLLLISGAVQVIFLITTTTDVRNAQADILCQQGRITALARASQIEREGQRALLGAVLASGEDGQQSAGEIAPAARDYLAALAQSDSLRANLPTCDQRN